MIRASMAVALLVLAACGSSDTGANAGDGAAGSQGMRTLMGPPSLQGAQTADSAMGADSAPMAQMPSAPAITPAMIQPITMSPPAAAGPGPGAMTPLPATPVGGAMGGGPGMAGGDGTPAMPISNADLDPVIPDVTADCPDWRSGTISFMGLSGITVEAGSKAPTAGAPMVFYWHGTGSFAGEYASMASAVHRGVIGEGGILVSFQGTTGGDVLSGTAIFGRGDLDLVDQLAACGVRDHNIDPHRIFATGCSAGGLFSTAMAALRSSYVAAAAPNSGGLTFPSGFENGYTPALMTIHGAPGRDVVFIDFSDSSATADTAFSGRGGFVINCNHGGGHCGGGGLAPDIWEFFKAHPYGVEPPWTSGLPSGFNSSCEIFQ